jgi:hypothetical protein
LNAFAGNLLPDNLYNHTMLYWPMMMATIVVLGLVLLFWRQLEELCGSASNKSKSNKMILTKLNELENLIVNEMTLVKESISPISEDNNNVILNGIPVFKSEDLYQIVQKIGKACGTVIESSEIKSVERLERRSNFSYANAPSTSEPAILVKFSNENVKTNLFNGLHNLIIQKKFLDCNMIDLSSTNRIYINHHLSPDLQKVFEKALLLRKTVGFQSVKTQNNGVAVKVQGKWMNIVKERHLDDLIALTQADKS